jgi:hypothetical protein
MNCGTALRSSLEDAHSALKNDPADAERRAKAVTALVRAERDVSELLAAEDDDAEDNAEAERAELLGRITRLVEADRAGAPDEVLKRIASGAAQA